MSERRTLNPADAGQAELPEWLQEIAGEAPREQTQQVPQRLSAFGVTAVLLVLGLLIVIGYALYQRSRSTPTSGPAPKFTVSIFDHEGLTNRGEALRLADLKGKVVVLNFWASYCVPCQDEAPLLERVWREYSDQNVVFLGVNTDDIESDARAYMTQYGITYPNAPDIGGRIEDQYRITGIPETFIINPNGEITRHFISEVNEAELRAEIGRALEG
jgi:cytochrome c biogenesis protein CcmG/thiol:disulfide interchange protein DsbE